MVKFIFHKNDSFAFQFLLPLILLMQALWKVPGGYLTFQTQIYQWKKVKNAIIFS
jgi:hypothetical protein